MPWSVVGAPRTLRGKIRQERSGGATAEAVRRETIPIMADERAAATASAPFAVTAARVARQRTTCAPSSQMCPSHGAAGPRAVTLPTTSPPTCLGLSPTLTRGFFWPCCRNRPGPNDYMQRRSLLGYSSGHARVDHVAAPLPAALDIRGISRPRVHRSRRQPFPCGVCLLRVGDGTHALFHD